MGTWSGSEGAFEPESSGPPQQAPGRRRGGTSRDPRPNCPPTTRPRSGVRHRVRISLLAALSFAIGTGRRVEAQRIGVVSGPLGSFAATILKARQLEFDPITSKITGDSLGRFGLIVVDNLYKL